MHRILLTVCPAYESSRRMRRSLPACRKNNSQLLIDHPSRFRSIKSTFPLVGCAPFMLAANADAPVQKGYLPSGGSRRRRSCPEHPPVDAHLEWGGRLRHALELLDKAHNDVARDEDNGFAQGLQQRALEHIDKAHRHVKEAIEIVR
jgi:hypothetical protein